MFEVTDAHHQILTPATLAVARGLCYANVLSHFVFVLI
jgi:hypothetical protein